MAIGLLVELILSALRSTAPGVWLRNGALDQVMSFQANVSPSHDGNLPPLTVIDVDEDTWRSPCWGEQWPAWPRKPEDLDCLGQGEPLRAPRSQLLYLINYAISRHARYVVVDVIVESRDDPEDKLFAKGIDALLPTLAANDRHILFVRTMDRPIASDPVPRWRPSLLDAVINKDPSHLHAVAPYFIPSRDGVVREWRLWQAACRTVAPSKPGEQPRDEWEVRPSVQILLAALRLHPKLESEANPWTTGAGHRACGVAGHEAGGADERKQIDDALWRGLRRSELAGRPIQDPPEEGDLDPSSRILYKYLSPADPQLVGRTPALAILQGRPDPTVMENGVVVIGQSFDDARDNHFTPLGMMPGFMVLVNSIDSMMSPGLLRSVSKRTEWAIVILLVVVLGFFFARIHAVKRLHVWHRVLDLLQVPAWIYLSYLLLYQGYWMDYGLPIVSIGLHHTVLWLEASIKDRPLRWLQAWLRRVVQG